MAAIQDTYEEVVVVLPTRTLHRRSRGHLTTVSQPRNYKSQNTYPVSLYVGIPHFANSYINKYQYDYEGLEITNPRPTSFHVRQSKKLSMGGGFSGSGHLSAFNASCKVPSTGEQFAVFPVPTIEFSNGATLDIDQDLELTCVDCLAQLAVEAATNQSFGVLVTGTPDLKFGSLPTAHLAIHKMMNMNGYNVTGEFCGTCVVLRV